MNAKMISLGCGAILLIGSAVLWRELRPPVAKIDRTQTLLASTAVGQVLAEDAAKIIQGRGSIVVVSEHPLELDRTSPDGRWNVLREELKRYPGIRIAALEIVKPEPEGGMPGCPAAAFLQILNRHTDASAILFLTDLPDWLTVRAGIPQHLAPKVLALDTMGQLTQRHYARYFTMGTLTELIGSNLKSSSTPITQPKTPREWFDQHYQVYTPQNFDTLPE